MDARRIIHMLEIARESETAVAIVKTKDRIVRNATSSQLIVALLQAKDTSVRVDICEVMGRQCNVDAVPFLILSLNDISARLRAEAADTIGRIGDTRAGVALVNQLSKEPDSAVRSMTLSALGAVSYRPAIPVLIQSLNDPNPLVRESAAWSLGILGAEQAETALRKALMGITGSDPDSYKRTIGDALTAIGLASTTLREGNTQETLAILIPKLQSSSNILRGVSAMLVGTLGAQEAEEAVAEALTREESCFLARRLKEALAAIVTRKFATEH